MPQPIHMYDTYLAQYFSESKHGARYLGGWLTGLTLRKYLFTNLHVQKCTYINVQTIKPANYLD